MFLFVVLFCAQANTVLLLPNRHSTTASEKKVGQLSICKFLGAAAAARAGRRDGAVHVVSRQADQVVDAEGDGREEDEEDDDDDGDDVVLLHFGGWLWFPLGLLFGRVMTVEVMAVVERVG